MKEKKRILQNVAKSRIKSYNYVLQEVILNCCKDIDAVVTKTSPAVKISIANAKIDRLTWPMNTRKHKREIYPAECRMRQTTYYAELKVDLLFESDSDKATSERIFFVPLMVKSDLCFLSGLNDEQLISCKEDENDPGGYFIVNGSERLIRQFVVPRRNFPIALLDKKFKKIGNHISYSDYAILVRSVKENHTNKNLFIHYVENGSLRVRLFFKKNVFHIPLMLLMKALKDVSDLAIVEEILKFRKHDMILKQALINMLREVYEFDSDEPGTFNNVRTQMDTKKFIGNLVKPVVDAPYNNSAADVTDYFFRKSLLIHLKNDDEKFNFLSFCICKLYSLVSKEFKPEDLDNPCFQEVLTDAQIYMIIIKDGLEYYLKSVRSSFTKTVMKSCNFDLKKTATLSSNRALSLTPKVKNMISTGNIPGAQHSLPSNTGFSTVLKRTNVFDTLSQFICLNKFTLKFYAKNMRKFYPESWGFLCPAQTPDGENCGLYNYLSSKSKVISLDAPKISHQIIYRVGASTMEDPSMYTNFPKCFIFIDGESLAWIEEKRAMKFFKALKLARHLRFSSVPSSTELVYIEKTEPQINYPGIYIFSSPCRLMRKVLREEGISQIGLFEQLFDSNFEEINSTNFLGVAAASIPFGEYNPAVRNIFTCMKSKQAVALSFPNSRFRADSKTFELTYPQTPVVYTSCYEAYNFDEAPIGINAVIAIMSYSGYDMEDAIVINKSSVERGLMADVVRKTIFFDFQDLMDELKCKATELSFGLDPDDAEISYYLDPRGLPRVGDPIRPDQPILSVSSTVSGKYLIKRFKELKKAYIESVRFMLLPVISKEKQLPEEYKKIAITYCMKRIPVMGDKFLNRHGQKGICGYIMPAADLPFSSSGISPDIIFNPHGLPSRMSVGMLLEIMASKSSLLIGERCLVHPFSFSSSFEENENNDDDVDDSDDDNEDGEEKENIAIDYYGKKLKEAGFDYYGTEKFYSGTSGEELEADIFCGSVYYFRLHHVVENKIQVESVNQIDPATRQPINIHSGAIRFGEMERDAILSHGALELTMDRLLHNSDKCSALICSRCKLLMNPLLLNNQVDRSKSEEDILRDLKNHFQLCRICGNSENCVIKIPHVLCLLISELSAVGVKLKFSELMPIGDDCL